MKFQNLSVKRLFSRVAMGLALSMSGITIALFLVTKQIAVLLTGGALLLDGKRMPSAELEKTVNERGISSRTMRTAKSRIGDKLVTEKDGTAWVCYLRD